MPAKSKSQFGWAGAAYRRGELTRDELEKFNKGLKGRRYKRLPEHAKPAKSASATRRAAAARAVAARLRKRRKHK